ncbi:hypothetical protein E1288_46550, partial [Saccharopolyspora elongata]
MISAKCPAHTETTHAGEQQRLPQRDPISDPRNRSSSGGPGESHPRAPTERSVTVSRHSALLIAIRRTCAPIASER